MSTESKPNQAVTGTKAAASLEDFGYKQELRRGLGLWDVVLYGVLFMVIIAPQAIFGEIQLASGGMTPLVYIVGFLAISFTAFGYKHMSERFPIAGSVYSYVQRGINPHVGFIAGWLILLDYVFAPALLYLMVANWGVELIPGSPWYVWILAFVVLNTFVNIRGFQVARGFNWAMFALEILAVILFIWLGTRFVLNGGGAGALVIDPIYQPGKINPAFIASAASIACLSFLGFDGISTLAEETVRPEKNIGRGIIIALVIIIIVFVSQTYVAAIIQPDWQNTDPALGFFDSALLAGGPIFQKFLLIVNILAIGIANIMAAQTAASRLLYSMGRDSVIPKFFSKVHPKYQTPYIGALVISLLSLTLPLILTMTQLVRLVNFGALSSFVMLNFAVFIFFFIKEKRRNSFVDVIRYLVAPFVGTAILLFVFTGFETMTYVVGGAWLIVGIIIGFVKSKGYKEVPEAFKNLEV